MLTANYMERIKVALATGKAVKYEFDMLTAGTHTFSVPTDDGTMLNYRFQTFKYHGMVRQAVTPSKEEEKKFISFRGPSETEVGGSSTEFEVFKQPSEGYDLANNRWPVKIEDQKIAFFGNGFPGFDNRPFIVFSTDVVHTFKEDS